MILADKIIDLRKKNGWSQEELADKLGVSRQAVSKWEGAQSIPDLERIIAMSRLFGVSTDFLLKEELEAAPLQQEADEPATLLRRVTMEEAQEYLAFTRRYARPMGLAVMACVFSPIPLLGLNMLGMMNYVDDQLAVLLGLIALLLMVAGAVAVFISYGMKAAKWEFLEKEPIETAYDVNGMVKECQSADRGGYVRSIILGVALCILAVIPVIVLATLGFETIILLGVAALLGSVGLAAYLFVHHGLVEGSYQRLLEEGDYTRVQKRVNRSPWAALYWCIAAATYLLWSFLSGDWQRTWVVWPIAGLLFGGLAAVLGTRRKNDLHRAGRCDKIASFHPKG